MKRELLMGVGITGGLLIGGCSDGGSPEVQPTTSLEATPTTDTDTSLTEGITIIATCHAADPDTWTAKPEMFSAEMIAPVLQVPPEEIENGMFGEASCDQGITIEDIENGKSIVTVENIGKLCIAVGTAGESSAPVPGQEYFDVIAICAVQQITTT